MRVLLLAASLLLRAGCNLPTAHAPRTSMPQPALQPTPDDPLHSLELKVFTSVNRQRQLRGLRPLEWSEPLVEQARIHSLNMMERSFFTHLDPVRGATAARLSSAGIRWSRIGENIFREKGMEDPAGDAVEGWMTSPGHRQSILDPLFTQTGVGIAISPDTEYFITEIFIRPPGT